VDLALRQDTIIVQQATARVNNKGKSGQVEGQGTVRIVSVDKLDYDLTLSGRHVPARMEFKDLSFHGDFDIAVRGSSPPLVSGTIRPERIEDREPFAEAPERPVFDSTLWDWDFAVEMPDGYIMKNDQLDGELGCDMRIVRTDGRLGFLGTADFVRGKVYLLDKVGRIRRGQVTFDDHTASQFMAPAPTPAARPHTRSSC